MKLFHIRQNNSGGQFYGPALHVYIAANSLEEAEALTEPQFSLCGKTGKYADYDDCGCCPCCGHRWSGLEEVDAENVKYITSIANQYGYKEIPYIAFKSKDEYILKNKNEDMEELCSLMLGIINH